MTTITQVYVVFGGAQPGRGELEHLLTTVGRETGFDLRKTPLSIAGSETTEPGRHLAEAIVNVGEENGDLPPGSADRMIIRSHAVDGAPRLVVLIPSAPAGSSNPWTRRLLQEHLARIGLSVPALARRQGWESLGGEQVLDFIAAARDGAVRQFDDVQVMVSLFPAAAPERIRSLMHGGYLAWADTVPGLVDKMAGGTGRTDFAHVVLGADASRRVVHLGYYASDRSEVSLPWDLLTPEEQRNTHRTA